MYWYEREACRVPAFESYALEGEIGALATWKCRTCIAETGDGSFYERAVVTTAEELILDPKASRITDRA